MAALLSAVTSESAVSADLTIYTFSRVNADLPHPCTLVSELSESVVEGVNSSLPSLTGVAYLGASADCALPSATATSSGTVASVLRLEATLPALTFAGNITQTNQATLDATLTGRCSVTAYTGAVATFTITGHYSVAAAGLTGSVSTVNAMLPGMYGFTGGVTGENVATVDVTLPMLEAAPSGRAWLVGPSLTGYAVVNEVVAVTYEAYAINLATGAVTHYTNYPFDNIVRFGNAYFGIGPTGIYRITGNLDLTLPIDAHIKTFSTKLGSPNFKRVPYVYVAGRSDGGVVVGVTADEGTTYEYESNWGEVPGSTNHRAVVGKGLRGIYFSLDIANVGGSSLELDSLKVHATNSVRGI